MPPLPDPRNRSAEREFADGPELEDVDRGAQDVPVRERSTRSVLILPPREPPVGAARVSLSDVLDRLLQDPDTQARAIGDAANPDVVAATLTEAQIQSLTQEQGGAFRVVDDTPVGF